MMAALATVVGLTFTAPAFAAGDSCQPSPLPENSLSYALVIGEHIGRPPVLLETLDLRGREGQRIEFNATLPTDYFALWRVSVACVDSSGNVSCLSSPVFCVSRGVPPGAVTDLRAFEE